MLKAPAAFGAARYLKSIPLLIVFIIEKYWELKIGISSFSDFYSGFVWPVFIFEYISEIFIKKFKYKLISQIQNQLNFGIELSILISTLAIYYLLIVK